MGWRGSPAPVRWFPLCNEQDRLDDGLTCLQADPPQPAYTHDRLENLAMDGIVPTSKGKG
jgi:hypothetical protein